MISIITSVHNQLSMNKLFYETLVKNTAYDFQLIVIDNNSTDGSREYFSDKATLILNNQNFTYPYCQNQGIQVAKYDNLAFLNNDLLVSENWDKRVLEIMKQHNVEVISFATNDRLETPLATKRNSRRWKRIKYPIMRLLGTNDFTLKLMAKLMYGNFDNYTERRYRQFGDQLIEGFSGSAILMNRSALNKIGEWDERIYVADFDIYCRTKQRSIDYGDMQPIQLALGVYFHHYQRLTLKSNFEPFTNKYQEISLEEKWQGREKDLLKDIDK